MVMARSNFMLQGAYTALITPFDETGAVDHEALAALVERQIAGGIDGLVPCGTTGESATMTDEERLAVIATVVEANAGRVPIIAGTGTNDTRASVAFTRRVAEQGGVDGALVVTPYYNKPGQKALVRHFTTIADDGGLPVVLYNVPGRTAISMSPETVAELARHPRIVAIKEATGDMILATRILESCPEGFQLLSGDDFTTFPLLAIGGQGCISVLSNLDPKAMSDLCRLTLTGQWEQAREIHARIQPLARALFADANPVPVKAAASLLGWCRPDLRAPLYEADDALKALLTSTLSNYGLL
jgi:4-hydroxy-tetrahydrodipicolinate synthase